MELGEMVERAKEAVATRRTCTARPMELREAIERAKEASHDVLNLGLSSVTGAAKIDHGWRVTVELVERKAIPDTQDLLGVYEVLLNEEGCLTSYERIRMRRRMDAEERIE